MKSMARMFILWVLGAALLTSGMSLKGAEGGLVLTLAPEEALSGATLTGGQSYPMTVNLTGTPSTEYGVAAAPEGGVGDCSTASGTVTTDADGNGSWLCDFTAGADAAAGAVTFTVTQGDVELGYLRALLTVTPVVVPEPVVDDTEDDPVEQPESDDASSDNHGGCVSYWAHRSKAEGLHGSARGHFVSSIAHSDCTTSTREDGQYVTAFNDALAAQNAPAEDGATTESTHHGNGHAKKHGN